MLLYHGFNGDDWKRFYQQGIRPRGVESLGRFEGNAHPDAVYLSSLVALLYADRAAPYGDLLGLIEVDSSALDESRFAPDTDYLDYYFFDHKLCSPDAAPMEETARRELQLKNHALADERRDLWRDSLEKSTQVAYTGIVPPEAFTRMALVPHAIVNEFIGPDREFTAETLITSGVLAEAMEFIFNGGSDEIVVHDSPVILEGFKTIKAGIPLAPRRVVSFGIDYPKIWQRARARFALPPYSIHGSGHWAKVEKIGLRLARQSGADVDVLRLFAALHDVERCEDGFDPEHGPRAADLAQQWRVEGFELHKLDASRFDALCLAMSCHTHGLTSDDATVGTCWDADRLDLGRVGMMPAPEFLSTAPAQGEANKMGRCNALASAF